MGGWINGWTDEQMGGQTNGWTERWMAKWKSRQMDGRTDGTNEQTSRWIDREMDGWSSPLRTMTAGWLGRFGVPRWSFWSPLEQVYKETIILMTPFSNWDTFQGCSFVLIHCEVKIRQIAFTSVYMVSIILWCLFKQFYCICHNTVRGLIPSWNIVTSGFMINAYSGIIQFIHSWDVMSICSSPVSPVCWLISTLIVPPLVLVGSCVEMEMEKRYELHIRRVCSGFGCGLCTCAWVNVSPVSSSSTRFSSSSHALRSIQIVPAVLFSSACTLTASVLSCCSSLHTHCCRPASTALSLLSVTHSCKGRSGRVWGHL